MDPGEGANAVLLMLSVFLLLTAYYVLKVVREPLILSAGGAELKSYTAAFQAVLLVFLVPAYGAVANRVNRIRLIGSVTLFFISNLVIFYFLAHAETPGLGAAFFIWRSTPDWAYLPVSLFRSMRPGPRSPPKTLFERLAVGFGSLLAGRPRFGASVLGASSRSGRLAGSIRKTFGFLPRSSPPEPSAGRRGAGRSPSSRRG